MTLSSPGRNRSVRVALTCTLLVAAFTLQLHAADRWAEQFTLAFRSQIINVLDGVQTPWPQADGAALRTVAGLTVGDPILVDADNGTRHAAVVTVINPVTHWVTWTPAVPGGAKAALNLFVQSPYALTYPKQSAIDAAGRIYTIDTSANRVVVFKNNGQILWTLGQFGRIYSDAAVGIPPEDAVACNPACSNNPAALPGRFYEPFGIDVSPDGKTLVVGDSSNHRVQVFQESPAGSIAATGAAVAGPRFDAYVLGGFGANSGQFNFPAGVSLGAAGRIAVADRDNQRIQVFTPSAAGAVVASDGIHKFTPLAFGRFGTGPAEFFHPEDVEFDRSTTATAGRIVVADSQNHRVQIFDASGGFVYSIQSDVTPSAAPGDFETPLGVTVDDSGRVYVADTGNTRIQIFTPSADGSAYLLNDPDNDVFGAEQAPEPVPGEIPFINPTGVAVGLGRLIVTELEDSRAKVLTRADLVIETVLVDRASLTVLDPDNDTVHVTVRVRNTGVVDLENVTLSATANSLGMFSPMVPAHVDLAHAGSATEAATFEFDFTVTGPDDASTLHFTLSATGSAGNVVVSALQDVDTHVVVNPPSAPAIALGTIGVTPARVGLNQHIIVTVPVLNIGGSTLKNVRVTATPTAASLVTPTADSVLIASMPSQVSQAVTFDFTSLAIGFVRFTISVTAEDASGHPISSEQLTTTAPGTPGIEIAADSIAPTVSVTVTPSANPRSLDGKDWYNGSLVPCAAMSCPPPAVITWPTIHVTAVDNAGGSGMERIGWRIVDSSNQTAPSGWCSDASTNASISPNVCTTGPGGSILWERTLTGIQNRIIVAFWAEDEAGNGAATGNDALACLAQPVTSGVTRINLVINFVTCVTLFIDVEPPVLVQGAITLNADNTEARIPFTGGDPVSQVSSLTSPDAQLVTQGPTSGVLILRSEGETVSGRVTVTDFARNSTTITLPFTGAGKPVIRLDHTPPEAFNRIDVTALGRRCTTTISGQPVSYACTNKVYGTDTLPGMTTGAFAPVQVVTTRWGWSFDNDHHEWWDGRRDDDEHHRAHRKVYDRGRDGDDGRRRDYGRDYDHDYDRDNDHDNDHDDRDWDGQSAELQTYTFTDAFVPASGPAPIQNPNSVTLVEKVRQSGNEARVRVMSYRYQQGSVAGPVIIPDWAYKKYEWARNSDGSLKSLTQRFEIYEGHRGAVVTAYFDARTNRTSIVRLGPGPAIAVARGLILLRLTTWQGTLKIEYDANSPVSLPDLAPPVLTLPSSLTLEARNASGAPGTFASSATDAVDGTVPVVCTAVSGSTFPLGTTTVGCSAADAAGNVAQRTMTVVVRDTTRPVLTLPATMTVTTSSSSGAIVSYTASAADAVAGNRPVQCSPGSGSKFKVGTTTVSCSASDSAGNTTTGSFAIVVKKN